MSATKLKLTMAEIANVTGESLSVIADAVRAGHLRSFVVGRRRFARPADVEAWIDWLRAESDAGRPVSYRSRAQLAARKERAA